MLQRRIQPTAQNTGEKTPHPDPESPPKLPGFQTTLSVILLLILNDVISRNNINLDIK